MKNCPSERCFWHDCKGPEHCCWEDLGASDFVKDGKCEHERTFVCEDCGAVIDRDLNAAINIMVVGSASKTLNARGADIRPSHHLMTRQTAMKREPSSCSSNMSLGAIDSNGNLQTSAN